MTDLNNENSKQENLNEEIENDFTQAAEDLGLETETPNKEKLEPEIPIDAQIAIGKQMIGGGLVIGFNSVGGLSVDKNACEQFAGDLAACICKWYPGGILAFMEKYKEELAVIYSGSMLFMAIKTAMQEKAANDDEADSDQLEGKLDDVA